MNIDNGVSIASSANLYVTENNKKTEEPIAKDETKKSEVAIVDIYEKSEQKNVKYTADIKKMNEIQAEGQKKIEAFRNMVEKLLNKQGETFESASLKKTQGKDVLISVDEETRVKAEKDINEGGYYSVEETSSRILDFAKAISGGDPKKIELLKDAVKKGFKAAGDEWGDEMPEITKKTYDAVMKGFDEWESAGKTKDVKIAV